MKSVLYIVCFISMYQISWFQQDSVALDSVIYPTSTVIDTLSPDTIGIDTLKLPKSNEDLFAQEGIDAKIDYGSVDSSYTDLIKNEIHLFGDAFVKYRSYNLNADYIIFNFTTNVASAFTVIDTAKDEIVKPVFKDGNSSFEYESLRYNFKTKKGIVSSAITKEGEFYLVGKKTKFVSNTIDSSGTEEKVLYNQNAIVTTCDHEHPHYGIRASKLKVIPNKLAVVGPSNLELGGVPTPIFLPFGFFPLTDGASSGLIFPKNYEYDPQLGLSFRDIGYYFPINEYVDVKLTADIYTRGSWAVKLLSNYKKRYGYNGTVDLRYFNWVRDDDNTGGKNKETAFSINISHTQDSKAHPYRNLSGSINISGNRFDQRQSQSAARRLTNTYTSNLNFRHSMPGTPFSFRAGFSHSQNTQTRNVSITLPSASLNMNTIYPLKRKNQAGGEKWYEKIALKYDASLQNMTTTTDTTIFDQQTLDNLKTGLQHRASVNTSFTAAKYFQISPSINYTENWYLNKELRSFDPANIIEMDSIGVDPEGVTIYRNDTIYGQQLRDTLRGFYTFRDYSVNLSVGTQLFGTKRFSKGLIRGIRHVMKPSFTFSYAPSSKDRYELMVDTDNRPEENEIDLYNPFRGNPYSPSLRDRQMTLSYSFTNILEAKYYSKRDSTEKNIKLLNNLSLNGNYNFAADSLNWSDISVSGNTNIYKGLTKFRFSARFRPYETNESGRVINKTLWDTQGKLVEMRNLTLNFDTGFTFKQIRGLFSSEKKEEKKASKEEDKKERDSRPGIRIKKGQKKKELRSFADLFDKFRISHVFQWVKRKENDGRDTSFVSSNSIRFSGSIPLSENWNLTVGNLSYNFVTKTFPYPSFGLSRDLHCWTMSIRWNPSQRTYGFFIGVKSGALNFLKYEYGQQNANNYFGG